jgi:penicillin-binding protein 1A
LARAKSALRKRPAKKGAKPGLIARLWRGLRWRLTGPLGLVLLVIGVVWYASLDLADLKRPRPNDATPQITLLDHEGKAFASLGDRYGEYLRLDQMSPWLPKAVIAIEDRRFYQHPGIDPLGIARAFMRNLEEGRVVQGGSTISQQLAKLAFLTPERSLGRKVKEALYTLWIEARFDKDEILEAYLNRLYLGSGAYGVDGAARQYFDKPASALTLAESAMIAGLIQAPSRYAPTRDLALARQRAAVVLDSMLREGIVSPQEAARAKADPARLARPTQRAGTGWFADWVVVEGRLHTDAATTSLVIRTTLDQKLQRAAETAVTDLLAQHGERRNADQAALVAMTPDGRIRAMVGGRSYADSQFNRVTQARRQPGSAFKLFVYLAALEAGVMPEDLISAEPVEVDGWTPRNFDDDYPRQIAVIDAFAGSVNTASVRLAEYVGREQVIGMAERLGITSDLRDDPSLALGSSEVSLLELTTAYAEIANGGRLVWPVGVQQVVGGDDQVLYRRRAVDGRVLEPAVVRAMTVMLEAALVRGTGRQAALRRFAAGKTGTSSDHRDALFVGFTDQLVIGVWVGNDDGRPMRGVVGGGLPALIFREFVLRAQGDAPFRPAPPPPKPAPATPGEIPVAVVRDAIGDLIEGLGSSIRRLFGG